MSLNSKMSSLENNHPMLDNVLVFETLDSTNLEARRCRSEFANRNVLLVSNEQSLGLGQYGRHWECGAGLGRWMSLLLGNPETIKHDLQLLSLYTGIVIQRSLTPLMGV